MEFEIQTLELRRRRRRIEIFCTAMQGIARQIS
jgi:hypothetical protein